MSGYLEVKLCSKGNRGLTPWKAWRKQWCILRPSALKDGGVFIVFHTSVGLASNSQIEIPKHSIIHRTESKTKAYSFGVFPTVDSRKPILLLAGQSESDSQLWIGRIRRLLHINHKIENLPSLKNGFTVSLVDNAFSNSCGLKGVYGNLIITKDGFHINDPFNETCRALVKWEYISDVTLLEPEKNADRNKICVITVNREFEFGHGQIYLFSNMGAALVKSLMNKESCDSCDVVMRKLNRRISRSEGALFKMSEEDLDGCLDENQRDSGLSSCGTSSSTASNNDKTLRISMDDDGIVLKAKKASTLISAGMLLSSQRLQNKSLEHVNKIVSPLQNFNKSTGLRSRCSGTSLASGIYEEISENPPDMLNSPDLLLCTGSSPKKHLDNTYEVLKGEFFSRSARKCSMRYPPPPLPPRTRTKTGRLDSASDSGLDEESSCSTPCEDGKWTSLHSSLPRLTAKDYETEKGNSSKASSKNCDKFQAAFGVFRKRIKSESQVGCRTRHQVSAQSDSVSCFNNDSLTRKRLFEHNVASAKSNHKVKNSKITRALKRLGVGNVNHNMKSNAKSCETLECKDETGDISEQPIMNRCSKSEENLDYRMNSVNIIRDESFENKKTKFYTSLDWCADNSDENIKDLSVICTEESVKHEYPKDILELLLKGKMEELEVKLKQRSAEEEYMLMSPCRVNESATSLQMKTCCKPNNQTVTAEISKCPTINVEDNYVVMKSV